MFADWCDDSQRQHQSLVTRGRLFKPPLSSYATTPHPVSRSDGQHKRLPGTHESLCRRDTRQFIMSMLDPRTHWRLSKQTSRRLQQVLSKNILPLNAHYLKKEKKRERFGEINQAYSGRDNKFAAYIEYGNPICLVPGFHGKAIPFSCFQRPRNQQ